jgi:autotransporter-associated beta strand protein
MKLMDVELTSTSLRPLGWLVLVAATLGVATTAPALIVGPYAPDASTVHLWHFDDAPGTVATNAVAGGAALIAVNGATQVNPLPKTNVVLVGEAGFTGFGAAATYINTNRTFGLCMDANGDGNIQPDNLSTADKVALSTIMGANGAFTLEAMVRFSYADISQLAASGIKHLISTDSSATTRGFQFRLNGSTLDFNPISVSGGQLTFDLANLFDDHAYAPDTWFHVAVTYNGLEATADNLKLYWTRVDATNVQANLVSSKTLPADLSGAITAVLTVGNENRAAFGEGFGGATGAAANYLDEVRISRVARGAGEMLFASPFITFTVNPSNTVAAVGQPVVLTSEAAGVPPLSYQWRHYGTNLPGATNASYFIAAVTAADAGPYDVVVTNLVSSPATSAAATLTVRTVVDSLVWNNNNTFDFNWDYTTANWSNSVSTAFPVAYQTGDRVRFDDTGLGYAPIALSGTIMPGAVVVDSAINYYVISGPGKLSGPMALTKLGTSTLTLEANNDYSGGTTINGGILQVGNVGGTGAVGSGNITNNGQLSINRTGTLIIPGNISGSGFLSSDNSATTVLLGTNNSWTAGPFINAGTLQIGDGGTNGSLGTGTITNNGAFVIASARNFTISDSIEGIGVVRLTGPGTHTLGASNSFSGGLVVGGGAAVRFTRPDALGSGTNTVGQGNQDTSRVELTGGLTLTNPIAIGPRAYLPADTTPPNSAAHFVNLGGTNVLAPPYDIALAAGGNLIAFESAGGHLALNAGVDFTAGGGPKYVLLKGAGTGEIQGALTQTVAAALSLHKLGSGAWTLSGVSPLRGPTVISNGTLVINGQLTEVTNLVRVAGGTLSGNGVIAGPVVVESEGVLAPGGSIGTLTINNTLTLQSGSTTSVEINKTAGTWDKVIGLTSASYGGKLVVSNLAGTLVLGDSFQLFSAATASGNFESITPAPGGGYAWNFEPASGILSVVTGVASYPTNISIGLSGSTLNLAWPETHLGWILQSNGVGVAASGAWFDIPGSQNSTSFSVTINPATQNVFYRLRRP